MNQAANYVQIAVDDKYNPSRHPCPVLVEKADFWQITFQAMASPCEILLSKVNQDFARAIAHLAAVETWRIEYKYSRYVKGNIVEQINQSDGKPVTLDEETERLVDFARQCFELSGGLFDISSGILRRVWRFDGSDQLATQAQIDAILPLIGWEKLSWDPPQLTLQPGMELDFGGIGKEYAVDRVLGLIVAQLAEYLEPCGSLVNFGGDLACSGPRSPGIPWKVGVESALSSEAATHQINLSQGAIATSGDSRRFLIKNGVRYSHILNPKTGWPVTDAPRSVTICAPTCTLAGMMATFAMLQGEMAETFLEEQGFTYWIQRM